MDRSNARTEPDILLEAGTNELEALVFSLNKHRYGINVAKVREVMLGPKLHRLPESSPSIEGVFMLRDRVVPLICLRRHLGLAPHPPQAIQDPAATRVIVAEFNGRLSAFRVDAIEQIRRVSLEHVNPMPRMHAFESAPVVALMRIEDLLVPMLDFEMIVTEVHGGARLNIPPPPTQPPAPARGGRRIVLAEDSMIIQTMIRSSLQSAGYQQVHTFDDGKAAWEWLQGAAAAGQAVDLVITDIEMPQLDGLRLCKLLREHPSYQGLPIVLFSSLVSPDNQHKGEAVGATAQISKPELGHLVDLMARLLGEPA
jgi:two-component system chemotaxis response regulator CheV